MFFPSDNFPDPFSWQLSNTLYVIVNFSYHAVFYSPRIYLTTEISAFDHLHAHLAPHNGLRGRNIHLYIWKKYTIYPTEISYHTPFSKSFFPLFLSQKFQFIFSICYCMYFIASSLSLPIF